VNTLNVRFSSVSPLLVQSAAGANPLHPLKIEIEKITSKRKKTEADLRRIMDLEYQMGLYYDEEVGPYIPAEMVEAVIREGAKRNRKGRLVEAGIVVEPDVIPLMYSGPRKIDELLKAEEFRDVRSVVIKGSRTLRCRPRFNHWKVEFIVNYLPELLDKEALVEAMVIAGKQCGLGTYRPRYGRFLVEVLG